MDLELVWEANNKLLHNKWIKEVINNHHPSMLNKLNLNNKKVHAWASTKTSLAA